MAFTKVPFALSGLLFAVVALLLSGEAAQAQHRIHGYPPQRAIGPAVAPALPSPLLAQPPVAPLASWPQLPTALSVPSQMQQWYAMPRSDLARLSLVQLSTMVQQLTFWQQQQQLTVIQQYQVMVLLQQLNALMLQQQLLQAQQMQAPQLNVLR